jgi:hypothetical protein
MNNSKFGTTQEHAAPAASRPGHQSCLEGAPGSSLGGHMLIRFLARATRQRDNFDSPAHITGSFVSQHIA